MCQSCTHAFGIPMQQETYGPEYFEKTHRRWFSNPNTELFDKVSALIPQNSSVLDIGCGNGQFLRYLRDKRADLSLTGVDLAPNVPDRDIHFLQGDFLRMELGQFDAVVSFAVIEHIPDVLNFVQQVAKSLRPNGVAAIMTLNESSLLYALARAGRSVGINLAYNRLYSAHHLHHFTRLSLRSLLTENGLSVIEEIDHNMPMAAIDLPVKSGVTDTIIRSLVWLVFRISEVTRSSYLQTMIVRPSVDAPRKTK